MKVPVKVSFFKVALSMLAVLSTVRTDGRESGLISPNVARRNGLERVWATQIEVGRNRGQVAHVTIHVSTVHKHTIFEVLHDGEPIVVSENQLAPSGQPFGIEGAKKFAEDRVIELKSLGQSGKVPTIVRRDVPEITLYATTSLGILQAIDAETGKSKWIAELGHRDYPTCEPAANDQFVAMLSGTSLIVVDAKNGELVWSKKTVGFPLAGPTVSETHVYVPTISGRMECHSLVPGQSPWHYGTAGRTSVPPISDAHSVAWTTDRGQLVVASANPRIVRFRVDGVEPILARPAFAGKDRIITVSKHGYVQCVDSFNGKPQWRASLGELCLETPLTTDDSVNVLTDEHNLVNFDVKNGVERWRTPGIRRIVSRSTDKVYCIGDVGRLLVLDIHSGSRLATLKTEELDLVVHNALTDRIYLGSRMGSIQCLREIGSKWPTVFSDREDDEVVAPTTPSKPGAEAESPFGGDDEDPFGEGK